MKEQVFGSTDDIIIGKMRDFAVDSAGRVYIADQDEWNIKVFRPDGTYIKTLGREGKGPSEFVDIVSAQVQNNYLYAYDNRLKRAVVFSLDSLSFSHAVKIAPNKNNVDSIADAHIKTYWPRHNSGFLIRFVKAHHLKENYHLGGELPRKGYYYFMNNKGEINSELLFTSPFRFQVYTREMAGHVVGFPVNYLGTSLIALGNDDQIYAAWSEQFLIKIYDDKGIYQRAIYYPYQKAFLSKKSLYDQYGKEVDYPDRWPALHDMKIDDQNRLWISTIVKDQSLYQWWVLKDNGTLVATFTWPRGKPIEVVRNGYVYTRETEKETGLQEVVRYRVELYSRK